jgi:hypothetical protein
MSESINALLNAGHVPTVPVGGQVQFNPLAAITAGNQAAQAEFSTRKMQADQAIGDAYRQAVDPDTGRFDPLKFNQLAARNPVTSFAAKGGIESSQALQGAQLAQNDKMQSLLQDSLTAALASPDANLKQSVLEQAARLKAAGYPADRIDASLLHLSPDPATLRQQLETVRVQSLPPDQRQKVIYGEPITEVDPTGRRVGAMVNPRNAAVTPPAGGQEGLPVTQPLVKIGTDATGKDIMGTPRQAQNRAEGRDPNDNGPNAVSTGPLGTGRPPATLLNPNKAAAPPPAAPQPAPVGSQPPDTPVRTPPTAGFAVGQGTSQRTAQEQTGAKSADKFQDIVTQGTSARSQDALLASLAGEAAKIRTGPGADFVTGLKRTILGVGAQFGSNFGIDEDKLKSMEDVVKIGNQLANAQGAGSDARLKVNEGSNPSYHNTPAGLDFIVRQLRGNTDYTMARQKLAATYPDKDKIEDFEAKVGTKLDPRVFQYQRMEPGKMRGDYFNTIAPADRPAFKAAHKWAEDNGLVGG